MGKVTLKNISHKFDKQNVLNNINFEIQDGELFTLLGPSGCGKTTLLRIIAGFIKPSKGDVYLSNENITDLSPEKRDIGIVFQNYALFSHMSVYENITYGLKIKKLSKNQIAKTANNYLDLVGLFEYKDRKIDELSGGQQQRVALARSLAVEPKVLLLDEPLSNLDAALRDKMRDEIHRLQKTLKITTIFITHDQREALSISDRIAVFNFGECIQVGSPTEIYNNPQDAFVASFVGETNALNIDKQNLFIRPELIKLHNTNTNNSLIKGIIMQKSFNGSTIDYIVKTDNFDYKVKELNDSRTIREIGDEVYLETYISR